MILFFSRIEALSINIKFKEFQKEFYEKLDKIQQHRDYLFKLFDMREVQVEEWKYVQNAFDQIKLWEVKNKRTHDSILIMTERESPVSNTIGQHD
jgi:hypothetical protein